jgi:thiol-disulfide isomerase/thioredoxin
VKLFIALLLFWGGASGLIPVDEGGYQSLLKSQQGKVVLVDFWATWCEPCRAEIPVLAGLAKKWSDRGLALITVSADEPEQETAAFRLLRQKGVPIPAYVKRPKDDDRFINSIDPKWSGALPALFLYDRSGRKVRSFIGETEPAAIEAAIRKLL